MTFKRAIVTAVAPLRIILDGDTVAVPFTPESLIDPATLAVDDVVRAELSGNRLVVLGRSGGLGLVSGRNLIINGDFRINQREYVSGATTAVNEYTLDRWYTRIGTGTFEFTAAPQGQPVTIGNPTYTRYLAQVIERENFQPGTHVVSWEGTAKAGITGKGQAAASYQSSPFTFESSGLFDTALEFEGEGDDVWNVKVERGSVPTPFAASPIGEDLALCQRYYQRFGGQAAYQSHAFGFARTTTAARISIPIPVSMRVLPTLTYSTLALYDGAIVSVSALAASNNGSANAIQVEATSTGLTTFRPYSLISNNSTSAYVAFDAEL